MVLARALLTVLVLQQGIAPGFRADWSAILPADYFAPNIKGWCSRPDAPARTGYWAPDPETISRLEVALAPELLRALEREIKDPSRGRAVSP
jgi:hypothetical protein